MPITVMRYLQTLNLLALACLFIKMTGAPVSPHPVLTGPDMAYLGSRVIFHCIAPDSSPPIFYELLKDGDVLISTFNDFEGNQSVPFPLRVTATLEGSYHCKARIGGRASVSNSITLSVITPASNTRVNSEPFPPITYEGSRFIFSCDAARGSHLSYTWFFNKKAVTSTSSFLQVNGNKLVLAKVTPLHAGYYYCMAWSTVQNKTRFSSSTEVQLTVKVYVSKPKISFSIAKEGDDYHGNVTCWSSRGTPPVNFSLLLDDREVGSVTASDSLTAWFRIAIVPGLDMGVAQCKVNTEVQELTSEPVTVVVVPVGGDVIVKVDYLYRANFELEAARLSCQISRGTFPYVSWLLNDSILPDEARVYSHIQPVLSHYALADQRRTLFLTKLGPEGSGYYRCRTRDSYDNTGPWVESAAVLIQVTDKVLNPSPAAPSTETLPSHHMTTIEAITIAFCCFLLLALALSVGCMYRMCHQAQNHAASSNSDAVRLYTSSYQSGHTEADSCSTDCDVIIQNEVSEDTV